MRDMITNFLFIYVIEPGEFFDLQLHYGPRCLWIDYYSEFVTDGQKISPEDDWAGLDQVHDRCVHCARFDAISRVIVVDFIVVVVVVVVVFVVGRCLFWWLYVDILIRCIFIFSSVCAR